MIVSLVVAMAENRVIGRDGGLPWHIPGDLKLFKKTTMGKPIVMGRKTWESLGRPLPGRPNIVITRDRNYRAEGAHVADGLQAALALAEELARQSAVDEIMVIGGAEIYRLALPIADRLYLTEVSLCPQGDAWFPEFDLQEWRQTCRSDFAEDNGAPAYTLVIYDRNGDGP